MPNLTFIVIYPVWVFRWSNYKILDAQVETIVFAYRIQGIHNLSDHGKGFHFTQARLVFRDVIIKSMLERCCVDHFNSFAFLFQISNLLYLLYKHQIFPILDLLCIFEHIYVKIQVIKQLQFLDLLHIVLVNIFYHFSSIFVYCPPEFVIRFLFNRVFLELHLIGHYFNIIILPFNLQQTNLIYFHPFQILRIQSNIPDQNNNLLLSQMQDSTRYRYFMKQQKMTELKTQFYRTICSRNGDQQHLSKTQLISFLFKQGIQIKLSNIAYFDRQILKEQKKSEYNYIQTITLVDRLSVNPEIEKQYKKIYKTINSEGKDSLTIIDLKRAVDLCGKLNGNRSIKSKSYKNSKLKNAILLNDNQLQSIFNELDVDKDGLVSYEDFLCAMISK